ncbi:LysR family transcriptional regulator substrate-binding protein [Paenibacillus sp. N3.4]|uniref:LysR family transcriptional regulator substrate-binding protein n=1 Tax=Paenibacillus sp. N3.4 TaxID=2603222 RepID=UPI00164F18F0|nr:LysR family transcriptional regulator substrate-binding protein [Paenibacillus sp. N3.4]
MVKNNETDLGLVYIDCPADHDNSLGYHNLVDSKIFVCVSKPSPFAAKESVTPYELLDESFVHINGSYSNRFMDDFMAKYGAMNVVSTSNNLEVLKRTIAENTAIGFFNEFSVKNDPLLERGDIVLIPLQCEEPAHLTLGWIRLKHKHFPTVQKEFIKYLNNEAESVDINVVSKYLIP